MTTDFQRARFNMLEQQVRTWDVLDAKVLEIMGQLPREAFVPDAYQGLAYADIEIPIGTAPTQRMLAPKIVGRLLQALRIESTDRVYQIGTGTGYVTACIAQCGEAVHSIEIDAELARQSRERLINLGVSGRIEILHGDAFATRSDAAPFAAIAVTGSVPSGESLKPLLEQLVIGGRLFGFIGEAPVMEAVLIRRLSTDRYHHKTLFETCIPALDGVARVERFVF